VESDALEFEKLRLVNQSSIWTWRSDTERISQYWPVIHLVLHTPCSASSVEDSCLQATEVFSQ